MQFTYYTPTKVFFGELNYNSLIEEINKFGKKVLILTGGKSTQKIANKISEHIKDNVTIIMKTGICSNPKIESVENIACEGIKVDVILTIGGGSVHDAGKALSIAMTHDEKLEEYTTDGKLGVPNISDRVIPVITIPTIFGTGAEVSPAALLRIGNKKRVIFSTHLYPKATFIDCSFAMSLPKELCTKASLDSLVQGIESLVSTEAQSFSKRFSYSTIKRAVSSLLLLSKQDNTMDIMQELALASIEGLYAVGQSSVGAVHAISDPLSGRYDIHHGEAVGILLPYVVDANYPYVQAEYDAVKKIFEKELNRTFNTLSDAILAFYREINFDIFSIQNSVDKSTLYTDFEEIISESYNGDLAGNPREMTDKLIENILNRVFGVN